MPLPPEQTDAIIPPSTGQPPRPKKAALAAGVKESLMRVFVIKHSKTAGLVGLVVIVLIGLAMVTGLVRPPWLRASDDKADAPPKAAGLAPELAQVKLVPDKPHTLKVPEEARQALGIRKAGVDKIIRAERPKRKQTVVLPGASGLDPTRVYRVRARFAPSPSSAKCVEIAEVAEDPAQSGKPFTTFREIRSGDLVRKDQFLAAFESVDTGNKKNDLIDALVQLKLDEQILDRAYQAAGSGALAEVFLWNARRNVEADKNTVARARNTLRAWDIPEEDIQKVEDEAKKIVERQGKRDPSKAKEWARVELRAPEDGIIIERNLALKEPVVDNTTNLFQIAKVDRLAVYAYCPEDDLPKLHALPTAKRSWTVQTVGSPPQPGVISDISYIIDPNQHTAVVKGYIDNPGGVVRAGQFISATIELDPPDDVVEIPITALVDDGRQAVVFVHAKDAKPDEYTMRRVEVTTRFEDRVYVRSAAITEKKPTAPGEEDLLAKEPLVPGDLVLPTGAGELKAALLNLESERGKDQKESKERRAAAQ